MDGKEHEEYWRKRRATYAAAIEYLDRQVYRFIERLLNESDYETTVIITSDHGENLGSRSDNYLANHKSGLTEALLHVPLSIINPPLGYASVETEYFSHLELGRLVTALAEEETPNVFADRIPAEIIGLSAGPEPSSDREWWDRMLRCAYDDQTKLVWDSLGGSQSYELDTTRPSWQRSASNDRAVPQWTGEFFQSEIRQYKEEAAATHTLLNWQPINNSD